MTLQQSIRNDPVKLCESIYRVRDNAGQLNDYIMTEPHKELMRDGFLGDRSALWRIINKGRQLGFSVYQAVESTMIAQLSPITNQYYIATKESQAKNWLKKVERIGNDARLWFDGSKIIDIDTVKSSLLEKVIKHMPVGMKKEIEYSYICGLSASPSGAQGETAINVMLDECAWMIQRKDQQREIYEAVKYFISQGGQLTIQSTPVVSTDLFWKIYKDAEKMMFKSYYCPTITNWKDLDLNKDLRAQNCIIPYPWVNIDLLEKARRDDLGFFKQRNLGVAVDAMFRFLDPELIQANCIAKPEYYGLASGYYGMAIDVAQKRDITAITVGKYHNDITDEVHIDESQDDYTVQADKICEIAKRYPALAFIIVDTTGGHGRGLVDILKYKIGVPIKEMEFGSTVEVIHEGKRMKEKLPNQMAIHFKRTLIAQKYHMLEHAQALQHCYNVEKLVSDTGGIRYSGKKNGRDDHFWSKAMLNYEFTKLSGIGGYEAKSNQAFNVPTQGKRFAQPIFSRGNNFLTF